MNNNLILTYDIGTTGNKCSIFDSNGRNLCSETVAYETIYPKTGWSEQRPDDLWQSVITGTRYLLNKSGINPSNIAVIGTSGHMMGCIPVDMYGNVLFNNIIHSDCRSYKECERVLEILDGKQLYDITGNRVDPHYTLPKILWIKNNYFDIYEASAYFLNSKDYISYKLTGNLGITDFSDASLTGIFDIKTKKWSDKIINELDIDAEKLPLVKRSFDIAGYITEEAAAILGLKSGTPVVAGGGDGACATKGAGVMEKGQAYNNIGSSSWISVLNDTPILDDEARIFNFYDLDGENCNVCGTVQCATISYDWVLNNIGKYDVEQARKNNVNIFDFMDSLAEKSPEGSNGVFFLPYLMGERTPIWDKNTKGAFIGFTLYNKRNDLFRAAYEGVAYALRSVLDVFEDNDIYIKQLALVGGGAKSRLWNEIMCNVYQKRLMIHKFPREATSLGAAIAAGVGAGIFKDFKSAGGAIEYDRIYDFDNEKVKQYDKYYNIYKMMYTRLKPIFDEISQV